MLLLCNKMRIIIFFLIQTLCMYYYSASYVNKFLGGKTIRIIKSKQTFLNDCCAGFLCIVQQFCCQHELAHFQVFNLHPEMKKVPSEAGEIHKYNYRVVNNKMMDFEENFFWCQTCPPSFQQQIPSRSFQKIYHLHIEHTVSLYYHQQCSAGHLLCMVKCHCKCPLHVCIMARLSLLLAKEILSTFCLLSF